MIFKNHLLGGFLFNIDYEVILLTVTCNLTLIL